MSCLKWNLKRNGIRQKTIRPNIMNNINRINMLLNQYFIITVNIMRIRNSVMKLDKTLRYNGFIKIVELQKELIKIDNIIKEIRENNE